MDRCMRCVLFRNPPASPQMRPRPKPRETKTLTWELIAIARSESRVAAAVGRHKVGVALNTERKITVALARLPQVWGELPGRAEMRTAGVIFPHKTIGLP